jgi:hypothetical protein
LFGRDLGTCLLGVHPHGGEARLRRLDRLVEPRDPSKPTLQARVVELSTLDEGTDLATELAVHHGAVALELPKLEQGPSLVGRPIHLAPRSPEGSAEDLPNHRGERTARISHFILFFTHRSSP